VGRAGTELRGDGRLSRDLAALGHDVVGVDRSPTMLAAGREAIAEIEPRTGAVVQAFTTGNVVQVFQLVGSVPTETWSGNGPDGP